MLTRWWRTLAARRQAKHADPYGPAELALLREVRAEGGSLRRRRRKARTQLRKASAA